MSTAPFDPDEIMRKVRKAGLSPSAKTANPLKSAAGSSDFSRLATLAAPPVPASFFDHRCAPCGQPARFGYDVRLLHGEEGRWFYAARHHCPETRAKMAASHRARHAGGPRHG
jgi:hypothetical protein